MCTRGHGHHCFCSHSTPDWGQKQPLHPDFLVTNLHSLQPACTSWMTFSSFHSCSESAVVCKSKRKGGTGHSSSLRERPWGASKKDGIQTQNQLQNKHGRAQNQTRGSQHPVWRCQGLGAGAVTARPAPTLWMNPGGGCNGTGHRSCPSPTGGCCSRERATW